MADADILVSVFDKSFFESVHLALSTSTPVQCINLHNIDCETSSYKLR